MIRHCAVLTACLLVLVPTSALAARQADRPRLVIENTRAIGITTTVTAIDYTRRIVTLTDPNGGKATFHAGPEVRSFDQVRPGETVAASYQVREVISVLPRGARAPERALRGAPAIDTTQFAATVEAIDYPGRTVLLRGPGGRMIEVSVAPGVPNFDQLNKGDRVVYRATAVLTMLASGPVPGSVKAGLLACQISPSVGFIVGSFQRLACLFTPDMGGPPENYSGSISRVGLDIGISAGGQLSWAVYAPTASLAPGGLAGNYGGASGQASVGLGVGANLLVGGSNKTLALQPLSIEGKVGLNLALGVANLQLSPAP